MGQEEYFEFEAKPPHNHETIRQAIARSLVRYCPNGIGVFELSSEGISKVREGKFYNADEARVEVLNSLWPWDDRFPRARLTRVESIGCHALEAYETHVEISQGNVALRPQDSFYRGALEIRLYEIDNGTVRIHAFEYRNGHRLEETPRAQALIHTIHEQIWETSAPPPWKSETRLGWLDPVSALADPH